MDFVQKPSKFLHIKKLVLGKISATAKALEEAVNISTKAIMCFLNAISEIYGQKIIALQYWGNENYFYDF